MVLDWLVSLLGFETPAKLDLLKRNRPWPQGTVALHNTQGLHNQWILLTQMRAETITKWSFHFNSSQGDMIHVTSNRLYNACHSGDIQAMCVQCTVHCTCARNLQYVQNVDGGKGKWLGNNHTKQKNCTNIFWALFKVDQKNDYEYSDCSMKSEN